MPRIAIVTDSTCDLGAKALATRRVAMVPLKVHFGDETLRDWIDISPSEFYPRLRTAAQLPTTSQPTPGEFADVYQRLAAEGAEGIVSIHLSAKLSGTVESAIMAASTAPVPVRVVDSTFVSGAMVFAIEDACAVRDADGYLDAVEKAALEAVLRDAERETRGADLRQREAALAAELADAVDRYAVVSVATALLGEAQRAYEAERQPALVRRAGDLLARFTGGRYVGLAASLDEGGGLTAIQAGSGGVRTPEQLSRGTREQLYLALRLAFIGELGDTGRGLPVLMDDVMVDFDDERKVHVATVIAEAAADRQIVLFTCHQATAELFQRVAPGHTRLDLDRC